VVTIDPRRLLSAFRRRLGLFAIVATVTMASALAFTLLTPREYRATAEVMLAPRQSDVTKLGAAPPTSPADSGAVDTELEILNSPQLARRVIGLLRLDRDPEFAPAPSGSADLRSDRQNDQLVVERVRQHLRVARSGLTYVIEIGFRSRDPVKAARIANAFAKLYQAQQLEQKSDATRQAARWLSGRLQELRAQVRADETAVQQFKIANGLMSVQGATLTEKEISAESQSLAEARAQAAEDESRLAAARRQLAGQSAGDDVGEALGSPTIRKLRERRAEASLKVATLSPQFQDDYPDLKKARRELADMDAEIGAEIRRIISNLDANAQVSRRRVAAIALRVGAAKGELAANDRAGAHLSELERNATASRSLYEGYLARYKETSSREGLAEPDSELLATATPPVQPSSPDIRLNLLLGAALAAAAGLSAVTLAELLETGLATSADINKRLKLTCLGAIPALRGRGKRRRVSPPDHVVAHPFSAFSEAFRGVAASITHVQGAAPIRTVAVTSALPGEGKTTTAICLARTAALQGRQVIIVDTDNRRRGVNQLTARPAHAGLLEVLSGAATLDDVLVRDSLTNADILPVGGPPGLRKDVGGSRAMERLLRHLKARYDLIVLDTSPVNPVADSRVLAKRADFVVLVTRWRATPYPAVQAALRLLSEHGVEVDGILLNRMDLAQQVRHAYGDVSYYYREYKHYYLDADVAREVIPGAAG